MSKYNVELKTLRPKDLSGPVFYSDFVYKFRKLVKQIFLIISKKINAHYKNIGYNIDVLRQTACFVVNPTKNNIFAYLFDCTTVRQDLDRVTVPP